MPAKPGVSLHQAPRRRRPGTVMNLARQVARAAFKMPMEL